jgi:hypothetical protein
VVAVRLVALLACLCLICGAAVAESSASGLAKKKCHPSYKGACLDPNAYDYDCIGGSGDGPKYTGLVRVVGPDVFRLDADHDGWGCERD